MPIKIPDGQNITVKRRLLPGDYQMPSMAMATDHYNIGFVITGDRRTITPLQSYAYHAGDVAMAPPFMYHRTISESDTPYDSYLIKFTPEFIEPFYDLIGKNIIDELYEQKVCHFTTEVQTKIRKMFDEMLLEYEKDVPYKEVILQGMLFRLFTTIWEEKLDGETTYFHSPLTKPIINALYTIEKDYAGDLTLEELAKEAGLSTAYFSRLFRAQLGMSFTEYLSNVRIRHVQVLLTQSDKTIMEIAMETGYCHGDYLSTQFKNKVGMTPTQFRKKAKIDDISGRYL